MSPLKSLAIGSAFPHGSSPLNILCKPASPPSTPPLTVLPPIRALNAMQGRVVCATNNKTVAVEVVRLVPHPKYKRRERKKKKYQAHDEENQFKVGDMVMIKKSRPISKTKAFIAVPAPPRNVRKPVQPVASELGIPLESEQA